MIPTLMQNPKFAPLSGSILLLSIGMLSGFIIGARCDADASPSLRDNTAKEQLLTAVVEIGPFAINSLYLSGEGPGRKREISVGDLIAAKRTVWLEPTQ